MIYESRFALNGYYRVAGIGEIANDISKNSDWVNAINERGETPLHVAAKYQKFDLLRTMLPHFSKIEACDNQGNTVMHALLDNSIPSKSEKKCSKLIEKLMDEGGNVNKRNRIGWTPVHLAARNCQIEVLRVLEKAKVDFDLRVDSGETMLHLACKNMASLVDTPTEMEIVNNLIIHGCEVNARNDRGYSVLHCAVEHCGVRVVEKLIDCGADLDCQTDNLQLTPLHLAVRRKNLNIIDALLRANADVNAVAKAGLTPLHLAVVMGSLDIARTLLDNHANVDFVDQWSALHLAVYLKRRDMFKLLVREQADVNVRGNDDVTPLHLASMLGNFKFAKALIDQGAEVNCRDKDNYTPLHLTIKDFHRSQLSRHLENDLHAYVKDKKFAKYFAALTNVSADNDRKIVCRFLLDNGADVNAVTGDDTSALHFAAETGNLKLVRMLLKRGAEVDHREKLDGFTALHTATYWNHADVVRELTNARADLKVASDDGNTALHLAAFHNRVDVVKELLNANVDVDIATRDGKTALHLATYHNHVDVVKELLNGNADADVRSEDGKSALHLAAERDNAKVFKLLFRHGAGVSDGDRGQGNTALHVAARENNTRMIECLMRFGAKVNVANEDGFTPLHCAVDASNVEAAGLLIDLDADVNCQTKKYGLTALHLALQRRCYPIAELLIYSAADVNVADNHGVTPLHLATLFDQTLVTQLLCRGADVHCADKILQFAPLHVAVNEKNEDTLNELIDAGADVNVADKYGLTPLHLATILGNCQLVEALIDSGANVNCRDVSMYTPLHFALCNRRVMAKVSAKIYSNDSSWIARSMSKSHELVKRNYEELVEFFVRLGADLDAVTKCGESLLHFAAEANNVEFLRIMMQKEDFDVNYKDRRSGMTPLQTAVQNDHKETAMLLISCGADVKVVTKCGKSLLHLATESGGTRVLEFLLPSNTVIERCPFVSRKHRRDKIASFEFDVNIRDYFGMTPLHLAALHSNRKHATETLLIYGASVYTQDNYGMLPIHYAIKNNRHQQLDCLLAFGIDVNDRRVYSKIELDKIGYNTQVGVRMLQHLIKLRALEFPIVPAYEAVLRDYKYDEDPFYHECTREIDKMRVNYVGRGVSLYNLLHIKRRGRRRVVARNIEPRIIERELPIYYSLILDVYHKTVVREDLTRKAEFALFRLTEVDLPVVCTDKIFHYLGIVSLVTLIEAAEMGGESGKRSLCIEMKMPERKNNFYGLLCVVICKMFDACAYVKVTIIAFVCALVLFFSYVPKILYSIFNKWT